MLADDSVDFESLDDLLEHHLRSGTDGIVPMGTTGESPTLNVDEHLSVVEYTINKVSGKIPVIAGAGSNCTRDSIYLTSQIEKLGADAVLSVVPYYNKPSQEGLYQHFKKIADSSPIPQVLYNVPGRTVADMSNETIHRLSAIDNIVACKDATGDIERGRELVELCGDAISILSGDDETALELIKVGGRGNISVTANVAPKQMHEMISAALDGDFTSAEKINQRLSGLHSNLFIQSNPIPVKYALSRLGLIKNQLRLPLTPLDDKYHAVLNAAIEAALG